MDDNLWRAFKYHVLGLRFWYPGLHLHAGPNFYFVGWQGPDRKFYHHQSSGVSAYQLVGIQIAWGPVEYEAEKDNG